MHLACRVIETNPRDAEINPGFTLSNQANVVAAIHVARGDLTRLSQRPEERGESREGR